MSQFSHWLSMGGYATYVWSAYGLVCLALVMTWSGIKLQRARVRKQLQRWLQSANS